VTGVLPVTLKDSTKIVQVLLQSGKEYICVMKLHGDAKEEHVIKILNEFQNIVYQRPPLRSSVKRQLRTRRIYYIDYMEMNNRNVLFKVGCESGTYIRKLCYDIGEVLGVGAHMQELRRTRSGPFVENSYSKATLHEVAYWFAEWEDEKDSKILRKIIQPMESALALIPKIVVRDSAVDALCHGASLTAPGILSVETGIRKGSLSVILTLKGEAVALANAVFSTEELLNSKRGTMATLQRVLMPRGTYPKVWKSDRLK
jgi:H/ACA ribonucleoprotein complex subunit 4